MQQEQAVSSMQLTRTTGPETSPEPSGPATPGAAAETEADHRNEVLVSGRVTAEPFVRELPSGDHLATWRVCVARPADTGFRGRRSDSVTCVSFDRNVHRHLRGWRLGDVVQVTGALRRRVWRGRDGVRSVCEVEARTVAVVRAVRTSTGARRAER